MRSLLRLFIIVSSIVFVSIATSVSQTSPGARSKDMLEVYLNPPPNFKQTVIFSGCYCLDASGNVLLLKRRKSGSMGGRWGIPGGKPEQGESPLQTVARELEEETGIKVKSEDFEELERVYVRHFEADVVMYRFRVRFSTRPEIKLDPNEHTEFKWIPVKEALHLPDSDITGGVKSLKFF